jgi:hypothetical protein
MKQAAKIFLIMGALTLLTGLGMFYGFVSNSHTHSGEYVELDKTTGLVVFASIGLIFISIGGGILYHQIRQNNKRKKLLSSGRKLIAIISNINYNKSYSINNRQIECVAEVNGHKQNFKSHKVWETIHFEVGQQVAVYLDTRDSSNYWVEVGE